MTKIVCPTQDQLRRLSAGEMSEADFASFEHHLEICPGCSEAFEKLVTRKDDILSRAFANASPSSSSSSDGSTASSGADSLHSSPSAASFEETPQPVEGNLDTLSARPPSQNTLVHVPLSPPQRPDELGRLGDYRILKVLGHGGMGIVYQAEDVRLERLVALKAILPKSAEAPGARSRFLREAKAVAGLRHEHVVTIHTVGEERGIPFLAMELLEGESVEDRLRRDFALPVHEVLRIGWETAEGLAAAHEHGVIHRDIKPANLWLERKQDRVKILDFGLARSMGEPVHLTQSGAILGTPSYMAPEQAAGEAVDHRCDLFGLGCVLYRMGTGEVPFKGNTTYAVLSSLATATPVPPATLNPAIPQELSKLISSLLEKDRNRRPSSAKAVADRLREIESVPTSTKGFAGKAWRRGVAGVLAAAAFVLVAAGLVFFWNTGHGTVRIEVNDPAVEISINEKRVTIVGLDKKDILLEPGKHGLKVTRTDFAFETDHLEVKRGETIALKIDVHQGTTTISKNGTVLATGPSPKKTPFTPEANQTEANAFALEIKRDSKIESRTKTRFEKQACTYELWFTATATQGTILKGPNSYLGFVLAKPIFYTFHGDVRSEKIFEPNRRTHLAGVNEGKNRRLFIDGKLVAETAGNSNLLFGDKDFPIQVGGDGFEGIVELIRISTTPRYTDHFIPPTTFEPDEDTLVLYRVAEGKGSILKDSSGGNLHSLISNAEWIQPRKRAMLSPSSEKKATEKIDLLAKVDLSKDVLTGIWSKKGSELTSTTHGGNAKVRLPVVVDSEYSASVTFSTVRGNFYLFLPIDQSGVEILCTGGRVSMGFADGSPRLTSATTEEMPFLMYDGNKHQLVVRITRPTSSHVRVTAHVDGAKAADWQAPLALLGNVPSAKATQGCLAVDSFLTTKSFVTVHEASYQALKTPPAIGAASK